MQILEEKRPVVTVIAASSEVFKFYKSGILSSGCSGSLDHVVVIIGYGVSNSKQYYVVKNSWGQDWGDNGYIKIKSTWWGKGVCMIQTETYAVTM